MRSLPVPVERRYNPIMNQMQSKLMIKPMSRQMNRLKSNLKFKRM